MYIKTKIKGLLTYCLLLTFAVTLFSLSACKKRRAFNDENAEDAVDLATFRAETDAVIEDLNNVINNQFLLRGKGVSLSESTEEHGSGICGLNLDTTKILTNGITTLNYTGEVCKSRKRKGQVVATILDYPLKKWKQKNCTLKVEFEGLVITGETDGQSIKLEGTLYMTNISGSTWYDLRYLNVSTLINEVSGNDILVYVGGKTAVYNLKRRYTYTKAGDVIHCRMEGLGEQGGKSSLECWGETRSQKAFTNQVIEPIVWNTSCGTNAATQGQTNLTVDGKYFDLNMNFGLDGNGDSFSGTGCSNAWKVSWNYKKKTNKRIMSNLR